MTPRQAGTNPRARKANARAKRTNPRAVAQNPRARLGTDAAFTERMLRRALSRWRVQTGEPWCPNCDDTGWAAHPSLPRFAEPCPNHREMTTADAYPILHPDD